MMHRRSGSALVFTLMLTIASTTSILALTGIASTVYRQESRREEQVRIELAFQGAIASIEATWNDGFARTGPIAGLSVNGVTWNGAVADHTAAIRRSYKVDLSAVVNGRTYVRSAVIANPYAKSPFHFAVASKGDLTLKRELTTLPLTRGSVYVGGTPGSLSASTINGDFVTTTNVVPALIVATGSVKTNSPGLNVYFAPSATYQAAADRTIASGAYNTFTFARANELVYCDGNMSIRGAINGTGTIYVRGNLDITSNTSYEPPSSLAGFVVDGNVVVSGSVNAFVGYFAVRNNFVVNAGFFPTLALNSGGIWVEGGFDQNNACSFTLDTRVASDQLVGEALKLPGYWP